MKPRNRKPAPPRRKPPRQPEQGPPPLLALDEFSQGSLAKWREAGRNLDRLSHEMFFGLESRRSRCSAEIVDAIRRSTTGPREFRGWSRLVDYQFTTQPLSMAGSVKGDGGRFNIGAALNPAAYTPFSALYIAEDFPTAFRERFGVDNAEPGRGLTANELVLRKESSFSSVALNARLESVIDVGDLAALKPISDILAKIQMPAGVGKLARRLGLSSPGLVRTPRNLQMQLLHPSWRVAPVQYGLPSNSQVFGRMCVAAGIHGILYPSVRNSDRRCLALFPQNWGGTSSFVELVGPVPPEVAVSSIDGSAQ